MINTKTINIENPIIAFLVFVALDILKIVLKVVLFIPVFSYLILLKVAIYSYLAILRRMIRMHNYIYDKVIIVYGDHPKIKDLIKNDLKSFEV